MCRAAEEFPKPIFFVIRKIMLVAINIYFYQVIKAIVL